MRVAVYVTQLMLCYDAEPLCAVLTNAIVIEQEPALVLPQLAPFKFWDSKLPEPKPSDAVIIRVGYALHATQLCFL